MTWSRRVLTVRSVANDPSPELVTSLASAGIEVDVAPDAATALVSIGRNEPQIVIIPSDTGSPDPISTVHAVAGLTTVPVVFALALDGDYEDIGMQALDSGARSLTSLPLTAASIVSLSERFDTHQAESPEVLHAGPLAMDLWAHRVTLDGVEVNLSPREFSVLEFLVRESGRVVSFDELVAFGNQSVVASPMATRVMIARIRRKLLRAAPALASTVDTVRGVGYRVTTGTTSR